MHLIKYLLHNTQVLFAAGLALAFGLDNWAGNTADYEITKLTIFGIFIAYIYSAPPLKLKVTEDLQHIYCFKCFESYEHCHSFSTKFGDY
jgi:4-hydroxybenzoate polyprenyltransferase